MRWKVGSSEPWQNFRSDMSPHNSQLQSLRGLAACVVLAHHSLRAVSSDGWAWHFGTVVLNAHAAVVLFFVLSGFVLTKSLLRRGLTLGSILTFYARRGFRIYPALWVGLSFGALYFLVFSNIPAPDLPFWVSAKYDPSLFNGFQLTLDVLGIGRYLLGTAWTITVELVASLFLPLFVVIMLSGRWPTLALIFILAGLSALVSHTTLLQVPFYLFQFALGTALAVVPSLRQWVPSAWMASLCVVPLVLFKSSLDWEHYAFAISFVEGISSLVIIAYVSNRVIPILCKRWFVLIGDWSYSIYLLHLPIAFACARLLAQTRLDPGVQALAVLVGTICLTIPLSGLVYRFVELPGIALGSTLLDRFALVLGRDQKN